jgi:chromosomal replication initiation ATPase DnaA
MLKFNTAAELTAHYRATRLRLNAWRPPPSPPPPAPSPREPADITVRGIARMVSKECGVDFHDLMSARRYRSVVEARWVTFFLAHIHTRHSLVKIGHLAGGRDHSTVIHGLRKMRWRIANDPDVAMQIETLHVKLLQK